MNKSLTSALWLFTLFVVALLVVGAARDNVGGETTSSAPARNGYAITGHDTNEQAVVTRGIYVGGAGDVKVTTVGGSTITFSAVPVGAVLPVQAKIVFSTGTTATLLIGLY